MKIIIPLLILTIYSYPILSMDKNNKDKNIATKTTSKTVDYKALSFKSFIKIVSDQLPKLKQNKITLMRSKNQINSAKAPFDPLLKHSTTYSQTKQYSQGTDFVMDYSKGLSLSTGIDKIFSTTGTRVSASIDYSKMTTTGTFTSIPGSTVEMDRFQPTLSVSISQPLLKNFLGKIDRYGGKNAEIQYNIDKISKNLKDLSDMNYYKKLYIQWIEYNEIVKIVKSTIKSSSRLEAQVRRKARKGLADNDDVQKMRSSVLKNKILLNQYKGVVEKIEKEMSLFINVKDFKSDVKELKRILEKTTEVNYTYVPFTKTKNHKQLKLSLNRLEYTLGINRNSLLPDLNMVGSVTQKSSQDTFSNSISELNDTDYYIGFQISYPIGNNSAESKVKDTQLIINDIQSEYKTTENSYKKNISSLIINLDSYKSIMKNRIKNIKAMKSQYRSELKKYNQARINLSFLITTQNSIAMERISLLQVQRDIINTMFDYKDLVY